ncbi:MAG TPA: SUMF1/EgtB/PvdO family nonheme iron enzyme [Bacteroidia bacterium]|nr:SUMF1/EgtB/PvdO family nonheme iron enzyme [Bacteroidia bacterium]
MKSLFVKYLLCLALVVWLGIPLLRANNPQISQVALVNQNAIQNFIHLRFSVAWENSWRTSTGPANWDAIWLFVKFRRAGTTTWGHATLSTSGHVVPMNATTATPSDGKGTFLYRNADGTGNVNFNPVELRWNYGLDGVSDTDSLEVQVHGIEMVYIPQGSFYLGDGEVTDLYGNFEEGNSGLPYQVTSESGIALGGSNPNGLGNNNRQGQFGAPACTGDGCLTGSGDDFDDVTSQTLPPAFPKGFAPFYIMKYEMTQQQFVDMLNKCTPAQQAFLTQSGHFYPNLGAAQGLRYGISTSPPYTTTNVYTPMIFLDWMRGAAYADWSGLRPMTELEFEKACRGPLNPVAGEYPWGNPNIALNLNLTLSDMNLPYESISSGYDNSGVNGNCWVRAGGHTMPTVARVGIFAASFSNTGRVTSGGSYYGVMEMGGNAWERAVSVGHPDGRSFTGTHGDGLLHADGYANEQWPGIDFQGRVSSNIGVGYRGGGLSYPNPNLQHNARISSRRVSSSYWNAVIEDDGNRFVRNEP